MCKECHIVCVETELKDREAIQAACKRRGLPIPVQGKASLFSGEFEGLLLHLPDWHYPAVIDATTGAVRYDNFEGRWGDQAHLDGFLQAYAVEQARLTAQRQGLLCHEVYCADGSIEVHVALQE